MKYGGLGLSTMLLAAVFVFGRGTAFGAGDAGENTGVFAEVQVEKDAMALEEALESAERFSGTWESARVGRTVAFRVYSKSESAAAPLPVIVYAKNLGRGRVGTEADEPILMDYIDQDYLVVTLDYEGDAAAVSPGLDWDLAEFREAVAGYNVTSIFSGRPWTPHEYDIFVLPEGYRLARDLFFWDVARHGAHGTLQRVMNTYNGYVVDNFDVDPVDSPEEIRGPDGEEIDYRLRLDIIYPSQPEEPVPLVFESATQSERMRGHRVEIERAPYPIGFVTRGMAWAIADHCWNPLARHFHYGHWSQYSLDDWNGLRSGTAAARFFRFHADEYGIDRERIGAMGHSKGAYAVTRLADPAHATQSEFFTFSGQPDGSPEPQPWAWQVSRIAVNYQSMGNGTRRTRYVTERNVPTVIACGRFDEFNHWDVFPDLVEAYEAQDLDYLALWMTELGHTMPAGHDELLGADRYELVLDYFERHLMPAGENEPVLLYAFPGDGRLADDLWGGARSLPPEELLPAGKEDFLEERAPITLAFAPALDDESIEEGGVRLIRTSDGAEVEGEWRLSHRDSRVSFEPDEMLRDFAEYRIDIGTGVRSIDGAFLSEAIAVTFETGAISEAYEAWLAAHPEIPAGSRSTAADPFGKGMSNLYTYAFDLDPVRASRDDAFAWQVKGNGERFLSLVYPATRDELRYKVEISDDLKTWLFDPDEVSITNLSGGYREALAPISGGADRAFLRVAVELDLE